MSQGDTSTYYVFQEMSERHSSDSLVGNTLKSKGDEIMITLERPGEGLKIILPLTLIIMENVVTRISW